MRPVSLPSKHYAANWETETLRPVSEVNDLGKRYAETEEGKQKESLLLELCQAFHPYLMKYLSMIRCGHVPMWGKLINKDTIPFIKYFLPKGTPVNRGTLTIAVRHFHLAFKGMETEEIYGVLMEQLVKAIEKYDPAYTEKVKLVVETLQHALRKQKQFTIADVNEHMDIDSHRYLRLLCRRGYLTAVTGTGKDRRISGFKRSETFPPDKSFFESGPVGLTYYIQTWFRYYLQQWINDSMSGIESQKGVYSLEGWQNRQRQICGTGNFTPEIQDTNGACRNNRGDTIAADVSMVRKPLDISSMSMEWVRHTEDRLFRDLSKEERMLLYLVFVRELDLLEVGASLSCDYREAGRRLNVVLAKLKDAAGASEDAS